MKKIGDYINGNYTVNIFDDGTKIRLSVNDDFIPEFAENCDCKITDKCSVGCNFCYEGSTIDGKHADLFSYRFLDTLHPYTELAINGNDLDHPDLENFLNYLKSKRVISNITVNQVQFLDNYEKILDWKSNKLINGLGISIKNVSDRLLKLTSGINNVVFHVIAGIVTVEDLKKMAGLNLKLLILGYKDLGRGLKFRSSQVDWNISQLREDIGSMIKYFDVISFDNLALDQLSIKSILPNNEWEKRYMGDDGRFTFYIDMVKGEFASNSVSQKRFKIGDKSIDDMFNVIKENNEN